MLSALREAEPKLPSELDWAALYGTVKAKVEMLEAAKGFKPSMPSYCTNR